MKKLTIRAFLVLSVFAIVFSGCKKDVLPPQVTTPAGSPTPTPTPVPTPPQLPINIVSASFGEHDVTSRTGTSCNGAIGVCNYTPQGAILGDPIAGYGKRFTTTYTCGTNPQVFFAQYGDNQNPWPNSSNNADGQTLALSCAGSLLYSDQTIKITRAEFGNVDVKPNTGKACNGAIGVCNYNSNNHFLSDTIPGYGKRFTATYSCGNDPQAYFVQYGDNGNLNPNNSNNADGITHNLKCPGNPVLQNDITVVSASFGNTDATSDADADCTGAYGYCNYTPSNKFMGDPMPGYSKRISVTYTCGSSSTQYVVQFGDNGNPNPNFNNNADGQTIKLTCP